MWIICCKITGEQVTVRTLMASQRFVTFSDNLLQNCWKNMSFSPPSSQINVENSEHATKT